MNHDAAQTRRPPPGQLKQQLALIQEAKEENERLRGFMSQFLSQSDKVKTLEQENADLKTVMNKLEQQLKDIASKSIVSNGEDLKVCSNCDIASSEILP